MKTSEMNMLTFLKCLFKGKPFTGKTRAIGSFPGPILIEDFDGKSKVLRKDYPDRTDIEVHSYSAKNYPDFEREWEDLQSYCPWGTVVLDSLTNLSTTLIRYSMSVRGADRKKDNKGEAVERKRGVIDLPEIEEYSVETNALQNIIDIGMILKANFILTAHILEIDLGKNLQGKSLGTTRILLTAGKKIAAQIPSRFEEMYLFEADQDPFNNDQLSYWIRTKSTALDPAGTLLPLPEKIDITDKGLYQEILSILKEKGIEPKIEEKEESSGSGSIE